VVTSSAAARDRDDHAGYGDQQEYRETWPGVRHTRPVMHPNRNRRDRSHRDVRSLYHGDRDSR
jgi:hypothetical protein